MPFKISAFGNTLEEKEKSQTMIKYLSTYLKKIYIRICKKTKQTENSIMKTITTIRDKCHFPG